MKKRNDIQADPNVSDFVEAPPDDGESGDEPEQLWFRGPPIPWMQVQSDLLEFGLTGNVAYDTITGTNLVTNILPLPQDGSSRGDVEDANIPPPRDALLSETTIHPDDPVEIWNEDGLWQPGFRAVSEVHEGEAGPEISLCWEVEWQAAAAEDRSPAVLPWSAEYVRRA